MEYDSLVYACAFSKVFENNLRSARTLISHFGSFEKIFCLSKEQWKEFWNGSNLLPERILNPSTLDSARKDVDICIDQGIRIIPITSDEYPRRFKECDDASTVLFYRGTAELDGERMLGVVGTRRSTFNGTSACRCIIERLTTLTPTPAIVSGLAYGIDECAHTTALNCGMQTIAVIPGSITSIYPAGHRTLASRIEQNGGILTDRPPTSVKIESNSFQRRNRIIAGISDAVLLAESFVKGGGLITTSFASSYNRDVFAVPGRMGDLSFEGCNNLIYKNSASIVVNSETIPKSMGWLTKTNSQNRRADLFSAIEDPLKSEIVTSFAGHDTLSIDEIAEMLQKDIGKITAALVELEMDGIICSAAADRFAIKRQL